MPETFCEGDPVENDPFTEWYRRPVLFNHETDAYGRQMDTTGTSFEDLLRTEQGQHRPDTDRARRSPTGTFYPVINAVTACQNSSPGPPDDGLLDAFANEWSPGAGTSSVTQETNETSPPPTAHRRFPLSQQQHGMLPPSQVPPSRTCNSWAPEIAVYQEIPSPIAPVNGLLPPSQPGAHQHDMPPPPSPQLRQTNEIPLQQPGFCRGKPMNTSQFTLQENTKERSPVNQYHGYAPSTPSRSPGTTVNQEIPPWNLPPLPVLTPHPGANQHGMPPPPSQVNQMKDFPLQQPRCYHTMPTAPKQDALSTEDQYHKHASPGTWSPRVAVSQERSPLSTPMNALPPAASHAGAHQHRMPPPPVRRRGLYHRVTEVSDSSDGHTSDSLSMPSAGSTIENSLKPVGNMGIHTIKEHHVLLGYRGGRTTIATKILRVVKAEYQEIYGRSETTTMDESLPFWQRYQTLVENRFPSIDPKDRGAFLYYKDSSKTDEQYLKLLDDAHEVEYCFCPRDPKRFAKMKDRRAAFNRFISRRKGVRKDSVPNQATSHHAASQQASSQQTTSQQAMPQQASTQQVSSQQPTPKQATTLYRKKFDALRIYANANPSSSPPKLKMKQFNCSLIECEHKLEVPAHDLEMADAQLQFFEPMLRKLWELLTKNIPKEELESLMKVNKRKPDFDPDNNQNERRTESDDDDDDDKDDDNHQRPGKRQRLKPNQESDQTNRSRRRPATHGLETEAAKEGKGGALDRVGKFRSVLRTQTELDQRNTELLEFVGERESDTGVVPSFLAHSGQLDNFGYSCDFVSDGNTTRVKPPDGVVRLLVPAGPAPLGGDQRKIHRSANMGESYLKKLTQKGIPQLEKQRSFISSSLGSKASTAKGLVRTVKQSEELRDHRPAFEELEQLHLDLLECEEESQRKTIDAYVAIQVPSTLLDNLSRRPKHLSVLRNIERSINNGDFEGLKALDSIYLTDGRNQVVESDFQSARARTFVWFAEGVDESDGADDGLSISVLRNVFKLQKPPEVAVVCMPYGAKLVASALQEMGVRNVVWICLDPYSQNLLRQSVKNVLSFCADILLERRSLEKSIEKLRENAYKLDPRCECDGYAVDTSLPSPHHHDSCFGGKGVPTVTVKVRACCTTDWFKSTGLKKLKLDYADIPLLEHMKGVASHHGRLEQRRQYFLIPHSRARERRETWDRTRALALYLCNEIARDGESVFDYIYRLASETDAIKLQKKLKGTSDRALVWVDFADREDAPFDSADAAVDWMNGFGDGPNLVLLVTTVALHHDKVKKIVSRLAEFIEGDPTKRLSPPVGPKIAAGQLNMFLSVLPYEDATDGTKKSLLDIIEDPTLLRVALAKCVGDEDDSVTDTRFNQIYLYRDDDQSTKIRICIADPKALKRLLDTVFIGEGSNILAQALSVNSDVVTFDYSAFASYYENVMMQMDMLTDHQHEKMAECDGLGIVRIEGGAGTGKTFIALNSTIDYLCRSGEEANCVLYVCRNSSLAFHFAKWLCHRVAREEVPELLRRIHFLSDEKEYPSGFKLELKLGSLRESPISSSWSQTYGRIVVDEAHDVFRNHEGGSRNSFREKVTGLVQRYRQLAPKDKFLHPIDSFQVMLLSDMSQASVPESEISYPFEGLEVVKLTEVCRSSKRIIAGAMGFQLTDKSQISFAHKSDGLPLRSYLFSPPSVQTKAFHVYAKKVVETIKEILASFHHLDLHDRLAVIVPDEAFREGLCEGEDCLVELLNRHKDDLGQHLVPMRALQASRAVNLGTLSHDKRSIIVDTVAEMDGLERLAVLGVGLDEAIGDDKQRLKLVCSRIYRAFTRAHLIFCLVNERIAGGWYEWIDLLEKEPGKFSFEKALKHSNNAAADMIASCDNRSATSSTDSSEPVQGNRPDRNSSEEAMVDSLLAVPFEEVSKTSDDRVTPSVTLRHSMHPHVGSREEEASKTSDERLFLQCPRQPCRGNGEEDIVWERDKLRRKRKKLPNMGIFMTSTNEPEVTSNDLAESEKGFFPFETAETTKNLSLVTSHGTTYTKEENENANENIGSPKVVVPVERASAIAAVLRVNGSLKDVDLSHKSIGVNGAIVFSEALRVNTTWSNVDLSWNSIGDEGAAAIAEALLVNKTLTNIRLGCNSIGAKGAGTIANSLIFNVTLTDVGLEINRIGDEGATMIAKMLCVNTTVTNLGLSRNSIGDEGVAAISNALRVNNTLTRADLSSNSIGGQGATVIAEALRVNKTLTSVNLGCNSIKAEGTAAIAEALKVNKNLRNINLGFNSIGVKGTLAIAEALRVNKNLVNVDLWDNSIGDNGAWAIAKALRVNKTLKSINLCDNSIGDEGAAAIADVLRVNGTLTNIGLSNTSIGDEGAAAIAEALRNNKTLTKVHLDVNSVGDEGAAVIAEALRDNKTLTDVDLADNAIGDEGAAKIAEALRDNKASTDVHLYENPMGVEAAVAIAEGTRLDKLLKLPRCRQ